jgi:tetratricopeptide (TPR) repeat protein
MIFIRGGRRVGFLALVASFLFLNGVCWGQNLGSMSLSDLIASADRRMQALDYTAAIPILEEILNRTQALTDDQGRKTAQTCRFELARILYQQGDVEGGMAYIEEYLDNEPRPEERRALGMLAQGFFEISDWEKIIELYQRLIEYRDLDNDVRFNMNLLAGQAYFQLGQYEECLEPLRFAEKNAPSERIQGVCQIMVARALVELESWEQLYSWVLRINRTDRRYDITLNLTLMKGAKRLYEEGEYLNSLYLYRMVLPRDILLEFANKRIATLKTQMSDANPDLDNRQLQGEVDEIQGAVDILKDLPPYEDEATFRIGQIYSDVKRYWEGFVLFDKLFAADPDGEIGEASAMQSVMVLYAVKQHERAEERVVNYLDEKPDGMYARTLLSMMMRDNLVRGNFDRVMSLRSYVDGLPLSASDMNEKIMQADLHYMLAFAYLQSFRAREAGEQFTILLEQHPDSLQLSSALYYRGMSFMLQADYANALVDFETFQEQYEGDELYAESIFRQGVCLYGLERIPESEAAFTRFIDEYPSHAIVSEAYSLRGDIEAAKEATNEDPLTLDRAQADYRKAIDTAELPIQASYPAFQAAKVYKMEAKWQEIIDLMYYYMDRWEQMADVAEAVYWIGQAQIQLGQLHEEAIPSYINAIMRFGNDPQRSGVDKIISELVNIADRHLTQDQREELIVRLRVKMSNTEEELAVLRLRLQVAQALLEGDDVARALAADLIDSLEDLSITTPESLSLMCKVAVDSGNHEQMKRLSDYFIANFPESDSLWHAYRARALALLAEEDYEGVIAAAEEAQGLFGVEPFMGWAQILRGKARFAMGDFEEAENEYNMALNVPSWRGPVFAEAMYGMGECRLATSDFEGAHSFFQRTYLLFKAYADGDWAAKGYIAAADCLMKLDRKNDAVKTLKAMLDDEYTNSNALAVKVRELLNTYGGE